MWQAFVDFIAYSLEFSNNILVGLGIPYSFGFAIILFTVVIKLITYPLNKQQLESTRATQALQPKLKELQKKYGNNKEELSKAQMQLYKEAGVNPLGGCLPTLVQMPIWFALYRALYGLASTPALKEGFFWIPSLAGPVTDAKTGLTWLWPLIDGAPKVGWIGALSYLVLPVVLVVTQIYMQKMMTPASASDDPNVKSMNQAMMFMPFMFGYFALVVPSGLSLYWFTNNILSMVQQYYMNKTQKEFTFEHKPEKPDLSAAKPIAEQSPNGNSKQILPLEGDSFIQLEKQVQDNQYVDSQSTHTKPRRRRKK